MDDVMVKGPATRYETTPKWWYTSSAFAAPPHQSAAVPCAEGPDGVWYEVIPKTRVSGGLFGNTYTMLTEFFSVYGIWKAGGTFSGWKMEICVPEVVAVGHRCTYEG